MYRIATTLGYLACLAMTATPAAAQLLWPGTAEVAQANAPRRALPIPNKPVSEEEVAKAARINNWTVGLAGGLLEGTFVRYAADLGKALDDADNLRVLPIISYGAVGNVSDLIYLKGVDIAITYADVLDHFKNVERIPGIERRVNYIIPMFQGEVHIYARPEIRTLGTWLARRSTSIPSAAPPTTPAASSSIGSASRSSDFSRTTRFAVEKMRKGEIAAIVHVVGKPNDLFIKMKPEPGFHFLPLEFASSSRTTTCPPSSHPRITPT